MTAAAWVLALSALLPQNGPEQVKVFGPNPAVVVLGASCTVEIRYEGSGTPQTPVVPAIAGADAQLLGPSENTSMSMDASGRVVTSRRVSWVLEVTPRKVGKFAIAPIEMRYGRQTFRSEALEFEAVKEISGAERAYLVVHPSATRVFVHQPLTFDVDYGIDSGLNPRQLRGGIYQIEIQAPWLSDLEGAVELKSDESDARLPVILNRQQQNVVYTPEFTRDHKSYHRFQFRKSFLPSRVGTLQLSEPVLSFAVVTRQGTPTFFGTSGEEAQTFHVYGQPMTIEVLPLPETGRPVPFYNAVGRFHVSAELDRQQVKVGNSVKLKLTIEGLGNTEFLRVPPADALEGFHLLGSKEAREAERVVVTYDLTPLSAAVKQVPPLQWNYFDTTPGVERYVEVHTDALPLDVQPLAEGETLKALPGAEPKAVTPGVDDIYDMKPAAEGAPRPLPVAPAPWFSAAAALAPWLLALGFAGGAARWRRRRADAVGRRARGASKRFATLLAGGMAPVDALIAYLADRMALAPAAIVGPDLVGRLRTAGLDAALAGEVAAAVDVGVAAHYGGGGGLDEAAARALVRRLQTVAMRSAPTGAPVSIVGALLLAALAGAPLRAQESAAAEAAYRAGDYARAADEFARAAEQPGADRRLWYNLGNARYRQGQLGLALLAYERARLAMPRDPELLANLRLLRKRLELGGRGDEPFSAALADLRRSATPRELVALCVGCHAIAALGLVLLRRRALARWLGAAALLVGLALLAELVWFGPNRPPLGVVLQDQVPVVAEPRADLPPVLKLREGVEVQVLSRGPAWSRVQVGDRSGYVASDAVGVVS